MFDKLDFITEKYDELAQKVSDPEIINNRCGRNTSRKWARWSLS